MHYFTGGCYANMGSNSSTRRRRRINRNEEEENTFPLDSKYLSLRFKGITTIPDRIMEMHQLARLDISGNKNLIELPSGMSSLQNLTFLLATRTGIRDVSGILVVLPYLKNLYFSNDYSCATVTFNNPPIHQNLTELTLKFCRLKNLIGIDNIINLKYLDITGNQLENFKDLKNLANLEVLICENCKINDYSDIVHLTTLETLVLSSCGGLREIPSEIAALKQLKKLDVSGNRIFSVPKVLGTLQNLKEISVSPFFANTEVMGLQFLNLTPLESNNDFSYLYIENLCEYQIQQTLNPPLHIGIIESLERVFVTYRDLGDLAFIKLDGKWCFSFRKVFTDHVVENEFKGARLGHDIIYGNDGVFYVVPVYFWFLFGVGESPKEYGIVISWYNFNKNDWYFINDKFELWYCGEHIPVSVKEITTPIFKKIENIPSIEKVIESDSKYTWLLDVSGQVWMLNIASNGCYKQEIPLLKYVKGNGGKTIIGISKDKTLVNFVLNYENVMLDIISLEDVPLTDSLEAAFFRKSPFPAWYIIDANGNAWVIGSNVNNVLGTGGDESEIRVWKPVLLKNIVYITWFKSLGFNVYPIFLTKTGGIFTCGRIEKQYFPGVSTFGLNSSVPELIANLPISPLKSARK